MTGAGPGLGASICKRLAAAGYNVVALARSATASKALTEHLDPAGLDYHCCDVSNPAAVAKAVTRSREKFGPFNVLVHNAASVLIEPFEATTPEQFSDLWKVCCLGAVNSAQAVLPDMRKASSGTMIFTGATAALRGSAKFSAFASAKFALRGLSQSLARELGPEGIHVAHVVVDGLIWGDRARDRFKVAEQDCLSPDAIAEQYLSIIDQDRSAWSQELDLRPYSESF